MENKKELEQITNCALCANMCKHGCPVYLATGNETVTPQKRRASFYLKRKRLLKMKRAFSM